MKIRNIILISLLLITTTSSFACSCGFIKIINAYSNVNFIGIVEFQTLEEIENKDGIYKSTIKIKELFKGNINEKIYVDSKRGSSCGFLPEKKREYFILGYKRKDGKTMVSYCLVQARPEKETLAIFRQLSDIKIEKYVSSNLRQIVDEEINPNLFEKSIKGIFLYKVNLNSQLKIKEIIPENLNAQKNFNEKIKTELKAKISYKKTEEELKPINGELTSYIILNWEKNYENELIIATPKL